MSNKTIAYLMSFMDRLKADGRSAVLFEADHEVLRETISHIKFIESSNSKLREELAAATDGVRDWKNAHALLKEQFHKQRERMVGAEQRAEAAEELVRKAREQEPTYYIHWELDYTGTTRIGDCCIGDANKPKRGSWESVPLYASPPVPADVQWYKSLLNAANKRNDQQYIDYQQAKVRIAELERKVAEQQKVITQYEIHELPVVINEYLAKSRAEGYEAGKRDAVPEWMPIETAPKDGTRILLFRPLARKTCDEPIDIKRGVPRDNGCWEETIPEGTSDENYTDGCCRATHWMPLPAAPKQGELK